MSSECHAPSASSNLSAKKEKLTLSKAQINDG